MESHQEQDLLGWQPGFEGLRGYPDHWYDENGNIPCPARDCPMLFDASNIHYLARHWNTDTVSEPSILTNAEHEILYNMLLRWPCSVPVTTVYNPVCNMFNISTRGGKELLYHEATVHGDMFFNHMNTFVSLVRDYPDHGNYPDYGNPLGYQRPVHEAIFTRLLLRIGEDDHLRKAIFRRAKAEPNFDSTGLDIILSPPNRRLGGPDAPIHRPIPSRDFLKDLWPWEEYVRNEDSSWRKTWEDLRRRYELGEI